MAVLILFAHGLMEIQQAVIGKATAPLFSALRASERLTAPPRWLLQRAAR
jgi:hypothetical protein